MSDELNRGATGAGDGAAASGGKAPNKRLIVIVGSLAVLAIVVGIAAALISANLGGDDDLELDPRERGSQSAEQPAETTGTVTPPVTEEAPPAKTPAADVTNDMVFTFRDVFEPLLKPLPAVPTTTTPTPTTPDGQTPTQQDTLYLQNIVTENGVLSAVLLLNGQTYTLAAGGVITGTPWQVLAVDTDSVTMLYGDTQVTLTVGQGIAK